MNLVEIFEWVKMAGIFLCIMLFLGWSIALIFGRGEYSDKVVFPWEKEERRAEKKAAKAKAREERRQARHWRNVEKVYR